MKRTHTSQEEVEYQGKYWSRANAQVETNHTADWWSMSQVHQSSSSWLPEAARRRFSPDWIWEMNPESRIYEIRFLLLQLSHPWSRCSLALSTHSAGVTEWRSISSVDVLSSSEPHLSQKPQGQGWKRKKCKIVSSVAQRSLKSLVQCNPLCPGDENQWKASEIMLYSIILLLPKKAVCCVMWHQATWLQGPVTVMSRQQEEKKSWER